MEIIPVLKEGVEVLKKNPIILAPIVILSVLVGLLTFLLVGGSLVSIGIMGQAMSSYDARPFALGALAGLTTAIGIISGIVGLFVHGMTVGMAQEAVERGSTSIGDGIRIAGERFFHLLGGAVLMGVVVMLGFMLFFIPGMIAAFVLMFTFVAIVLEDLGPVQGMKRSYEVVKTHVGEVLVLFVVMVGIGLLVGVLSAALGFIPIIGQLIPTLLSGAFGGYITIVMVLVYKKISEPDPAPQG